MTVPECSLATDSTAEGDGEAAQNIHRQSSTRLAVQVRTDGDLLIFTVAYLQRRSSRSLREVKAQR